MHCPRCGQLQISNQTRFCSRCGFQLGLVAELLENGGFLPQLATLQGTKDSWFSRRNGITFSFLWLIFWMMMVPAFFSALGVNRLPGAFAAFGFFSSLMLMVISFTLLKRKPKTQQLPSAMPTQLYAGGAAALPPQQSEPASTYMPPEGSWRAPNTGDLAARPGSVVEGTTKLLPKDD